MKSENIGDCSGAVLIKNHQKFEAEFTGKAGYNNDIASYTDSVKLQPFNTFWFTVNTKLNGRLSIVFPQLPEQTEIVLFRTGNDEGCSAIHHGKGQILKSVLYTNDNNQNNLNTLIQSGFHYYIYVNTLKEGNKEFIIQTSFEDQRTAQEVKKLQSVKDLRSERTAPTFTLHIVDEETLLPVESSIVVKNSKSYNALYSANVLRFPDSEYLSLDLEINAPGYFFKDLRLNRRTIESDSLTVQLRPIKTNDQIEIEGLEFESESDVLVEDAIPKMRRLRDFLALNKNVKIEVIGHVHKEGRNSWKAKRLSKKRAQRVKSFLVNSGIDGDRIITKGMGNAEMKFPKAVTDAQIQANRRVEIKIK